MSPEVFHAGGWHSRSQGHCLALFFSREIVWANIEVEGELARIEETKHKKRGLYKGIHDAQTVKR